MKKITLITLLLISINAIAQTGVINEKIDNGALNPALKLDQLDQMDITTGNLINRSFLFANHTKFYKDVVDTNNYGGWKQLYLEIYNAYYNNSILPSLTSIKNDVKQQTANEIIPLLIMDLEYNRIKDSALVDSLLVIEDGIFKDVLQRTESPYETQRIVTFTPATDIIYKKETTFLLSKAFFYTNQTSDPNSIEIDFDDGLGYRAINWETTYAINYSNVNSKTLSIKINYGNGNINWK